MSKILETETETDAELRERILRELDEISRMVLRRRGIPEHELPAAIERMWLAGAKWKFPTIEELEAWTARDEPV